MIARLSGRVAALGANWVVIDVGGVGYKVCCPPGTAAGLRPGGDAVLATSLVVREDSMTLYGFGEASERDAFELLQTSSGVGPRIALATVSVLTPAQLAAAIRAEDLNTLTKVPGVGRKGAQKMVLDLREKVLGLDVGSPVPEPGVSAPAGGAELWREQVASGLQGLGWSAKDAEAACEKVAGLVAEDPAVSLGTLMKAALQSLART